MTAMTTLDLALITYGADGIDRVTGMVLPPMEGVRYVVSWQESGGKPIPEGLQRDDVTVVRMDGRGAARNRNNAIAHCTADIILFADDDLVYTPMQLRAVTDTFDANPDTDLATFAGRHPSPPAYPTAPCRLTVPLPRGYWVSAYLIAYRRETVGDLLCHPDFGAGAEWFTGADDELFLLAAIRRGLRCRFFPVEICTHAGQSTGTNARLSAGNLRATGCYIALAFGWTAPLRIVLKSLRVARRGQASWLPALYHLTSGAASAPGILRRSRRYLW